MQLLINFIRSQFTECIAKIEDLKKKKHITSTANPLYRDLLFIEIMSKYQNGTRDLIGQLRSLSTVCGDKSLFEHKAYNILLKYIKDNTGYNKTSYADKFPQKYKELESLKLNGEPLQSIICGFLKGYY